MKNSIIRLFAFSALLFTGESFGADYILSSVKVNHRVTAYFNGISDYIDVSSSDISLLHGGFLEASTKVKQTTLFPTVYSKIDFSAKLPGTYYNSQYSGSISLEEMESTGWKVLYSQVCFYNSCKLYYTVPSPAPGTSQASYGLPAGKYRIRIRNSNDFNNYNLEFQAWSKL